ncbi:MAG: glycosyltransferase family 39 protein [Verrucomicrobiae bacterium]|nr:glycosyltransferase family 39 protein [Verrucomicrobiae bacterium]
MLWILAGLITARWVWVAGIGDYGWTYEVARRIVLGEVQHRDFICCLPVLTHYTLAALLGVLGDSLWCWAIHLYCWWLAALLVGWQLLRRLTVDTNLRQAGVILMAIFSNPAGTLGHAHNYASTTFAGLGALFILRALADGRDREWFLSGLSIGLATLAKQNVGCMAAVAACGVVLWQGFQEGNTKKSLGRLGRLTLGIATAFVPAATFFGAHAGYSEFLRQYFLDAGTAKGGIALVLGRALPRIILMPETPHRRIVEGLISAPLLLGAGAWLWLRLRDAASRRDFVTGEITPQPLSRLAVGGFLVSMTMLSVVSLWPWDSVRAPLPFDVSRFVPTGAEVFIQLAYLLSVTAFVVAGFRFRNCLNWFAVSVLGGVILFSAATSSILYYPFCAPVVLPMLLGLLHQSGGFPNLARQTLLVGVLFLVVFFFRPVFAPTFAALKPLPSGSPFAGLYAPAGTAELVADRWGSLTPWIRGRRTLWLCSGGPHSAYGGLPVKNVPLFYKDTYHSRHEPSLRRAWEAQPPEFVVVGPFLPAAGARLLTAEGIREWLGDRFELVWRARGEELTLWRRKTSPPQAMPRQVAPGAVFVPHQAVWEERLMGCGEGIQCFSTHAGGNTAGVAVDGGATRLPR